MKKPIAILGNSGHAFVVLESLSTMNLDAAGYFDKRPVDFNPFKLDYLGFEGDPQSDLRDFHFIMGIGDNKIRKKAFEQVINSLGTDAMHQLDINEVHLKNSNDSFTINSNNPLNDIFLNVIDISSNISSSAYFGFGNYIGKRTSINAFSKIGSNCILNTGCIIEHECTVENHCHIAPGSVILGNVQIGTGTLVGANSTILPGINVGANSIIGAGSVVTKNIPENGKWIGNKPVI